MLLISITRIDRLIFILLLFSSFNCLSDITVENCTDGVFKNSYFIIQVDEVEQVSLFFQQITQRYFPLNNNLFAVSAGSRDRSETYYDDDSLTLLRNGQELLHDLHHNLPQYRVERERIIFKNNILTHNKNTYFEVKNYNKKATALDKHKLFGRVKRKQRQSLIDSLKILISNPVVELKQNLKVEHEEIVQLYSHYGVGYGEIVWDKFQVSNFGLSNTYSLLKFEIYEDKIEQLNDRELAMLNQFFCSAYAGFQQQYPQIKAENKFGYQAFYNLAKQQLPTRDLFKKYPLLYSLGQVLLLVFIGFLFLYLFTGRYTKRQHYRNVMVGRHDNNDQS